MSLFFFLSWFLSSASFKSLILSHMTLTSLLNFCWYSVFHDLCANCNNWLNYADGSDRSGEAYYNFHIFCSFNQLNNLSCGIFKTAMLSVLLVLNHLSLRIMVYAIQNVFYRQFFKNDCFFLHRFYDHLKQAIIFLMRKFQFLLD